MARNVLLWIVCGVWLAGTAWGQGERRLSLDDYRDRMKGGWIGQIIGVAWGAPTEFKFNDVIIPQEKVPVWKPEMINHAFGEDDLYVEMTFLRSLEQYGLDVDIRQAGIDFANSSTNSGAPMTQAAGICAGYRTAGFVTPAFQLPPE